MEGKSVERLALAWRLRDLRLGRWPDVRISQASLGRALGEGEPVSRGTISSWESPWSPKIPSFRWIEAYARFFATRRSVESDPAHVFDVGQLTPSERAEYGDLREELSVLHLAAMGGASAGILDFWRFPGPARILIVCGQRENWEPSERGLPDSSGSAYKIYSYLNLDAAVDLYGYLKSANPYAEVRLVGAVDLTPDEVHSHLVLLGPDAWDNIVARMPDINDFPVEQIKKVGPAGGRSFRVSGKGLQKDFMPTWDSRRSELTEDVGILGRMPNQMAPGYSVTICSGTSHPGVLGAVQSLTDPRFRELNGRYVGAKFSGSEAFFLLMRVPVFSGSAIAPDFTLPGGLLCQQSWRPASKALKIFRTQQKGRRIEAGQEADAALGSGTREYSRFTPIIEPSTRFAASGYTYPPERLGSIIGQLAGNRMQARQAFKVLPSAAIRVLTRMKGAASSDQGSDLNHKRDAARRSRQEAVLLENRPANPEYLSSWPEWANVVPHLKALNPGTTRNPEMRELACEAAAYLFELGDYEGCRDFAAELLYQWEKYPGEDDGNTRWIMHILASALGELGDFAAARDLHARCLERQESLLGENHKSSLLSATSLARCMAKLGDTRAARDIDRDALDRSRREFGNCDSMTLGIGNNLSLDLLSLGETQAAKKLLEEILQTYRRMFGADNRGTLRSTSNLARALSHEGEHAAARKLNEDVLERRRRTLGHDHLDTLTTADDLTANLRALGDTQAALALEQDTLASLRGTLGADHPQALAAATRLAINLHLSGEVQAALDLDKDTWARQKQVLGANHPDTLATEYNLAIDHYALGDDRTALKICQDAYSRLRRTLGETDPKVARSGTALAVILRKNGNASTAAKIERSIKSGQRPKENARDAPHSPVQDDADRHDATE